MELDIGGALAETAAPGISREALERLDDRVSRAHKRIQQERTRETHGYAALNLPDNVDLEQIQTTVAQFESVDAVVVAGIGGSALGAATLADACDASLYTLDNVDPEATQSLLASLPLERTVLVAVSRSGTTAETLANFLVAREALTDAGVDWTDRTLVITGDDGPLATLVTRHSLPRLSVPTGVPGRYSVLSAVGLAPAALAGVDIEAVLAGGQDAADTLSGSLFSTPAYGYGAVAYALAVRGVTVNAMMPYAERLETFAEWFAQLWAESLGKDGVGQFPVRALGATDQHSQLQLYRSGPRSLFVSAVTPASRPSVSIPSANHDALAYLDGTELGALLDTEREATLASLAAVDRPTVNLTVADTGPRSIGKLLYTMEAACIMAGELYGIDPFTQPAVEWGKRATRGLLGGADTPETRSVRNRTSLMISDN